jgi:hypothetical protein
MKDKIKECIEKYNELIEKYKPLSKEEIIVRLKEMTAEKVGPIKLLSFIVLNDNFDPYNFSQEIEDSEEFIDTWSLAMEEMKKPEFDFIWNNTIGKLPRNSEKWLDNHHKICYVKYKTITVQCIVHEDGTRDYNSNENIDKVLKIQEQYKIIINFN